MTVERVKVVKNLLSANDQAAERNRRRLDDARVLAVNLMASPGAGKTSLIVKTMAALGARASIGVIEGDIAGSIDTERVLSSGAADAIQINTGGGCHLDAGMVGRALDELALSRIGILFVENVGNLICPTQWRLGEHLKLCLLSSAEGHDKPVKYPEVFAVSDVIVLNKIDLIELVDFDRGFFYESVRALNPDAPIFEISCRTGEGLDGWVNWLSRQRTRLERDEGLPCVSP